MLPAERLQEKARKKGMILHIGVGSRTGIISSDLKIATTPELWNCRLRGRKQNVISEGIIFCQQVSGKTSEEIFKKGQRETDKCLLFPLP